MVVDAVRNRVQERTSGRVPGRSCGPRGGVSHSALPLVTLGSGGSGWPSRRTRCGTTEKWNSGMKVVLPQINFIEGSEPDECRIHRCPGQYPRTRWLPIPGEGGHRT